MLIQILIDNIVNFFESITFEQSAKIQIINPSSWKTALHDLLLMRQWILGDPFLDLRSWTACEGSGWIWIH